MVELVEESFSMLNGEERDRFSFEDSDRFEEDSLCSYISEPESLCNNWRGWKKQNSSSNSSHFPQGQSSCLHLREDGGVPSLVELAARQVGFHIPFEVVERVYPPVPEQLQLRIAVWSFPENEEDIRLYSCLANGSGDEFMRGETFYKGKAVKDPLQIGFHLSATVVTPQSVSGSKWSYNVAITFDRKRITSCNCTCSSTASWCAHVVAMCLHRIHLPNQVCLRAPVSESLSRLNKVQLRKFAQYLIYEQPQQILPTAQRLLDELLSCPESLINSAPGAPDPTAGASVSEQTTWCLDEANLHENIRKILIKFCVPSPIVFSDVNYLSTTAPPAAAEWTSLLRPLRGREPEGMWNLLSIVREMFRRHDRNAIPLLEILTEECLACDQIMLWWFNTKVSLLNSVGNMHSGRSNGVNSNTNTSQHACSSLCEEIVILWRLAALNPALSPIDRASLNKQFKTWHLKIVEKVCKVRSGISASISGVTPGGPAPVSANSAVNNSIRKSEIEIFPGFKPALEACLLDWKNYSIPCITYEEGICSKWCNPVTHARSFIEPCRDISSSPAVLTCDSRYLYSYPSSSKRGRSVEIGQSPSSPHESYSNTVANHDSLYEADNYECRPSVYRNQDGNRSSVSSEGFCENEQLDMTMVNVADVASNANVVITVNESSDHQSNSDEAMSADPMPTTSSRASQRTYDKCDVKSFSVADDQDSDWSSSVAESLAQKLPKKDGKAAGSADSNVANDNNDGASEEWSPHSSDDQYQVYVYDPQAKLSPAGQAAQSKDNNYIFANVKKLEDPIEVLFARAEALHTHGHTQHACKLAVKLAEEMLENPPNLIADLMAPPAKGKRSKRQVVVNTASHQMSCLASATLAKAAFLCTVLSENNEHHHLAFKVGMFGLEMPRPPASTKALEVKLANQESDLVVLLKKIPLGPEELKVVKERAMQLKDGTLRSRGEALLPLVLASFIFDSLCLPACSKNGSTTPKNSNNEQLGFQAAVAALGLKANVSEAEHPLLCEGTRRQRGDLAIMLLVHYKNDQAKLAQIMDKLLDKEVHCMYKTSTINQPSHVPPKPAANGTTSNAANAKVQAADEEQTQNKITPDNGQNLSNQMGALEISATASKTQPNGSAATSSSTSQETRGPAGVSCDEVASSTAPGTLRKMRDSSYSSLRESVARRTRSPTWEEDYKAWEAKFRCTNFKTNKKHSEGMASIDSSAPETTSSDNSPTMVRRHGWSKPVGPGSDSGSSGKSSDSFGSSSSGTGLVVANKSPGPRLKARETDSPLSTFAPSRYCQSLYSIENVGRTYISNSKNSRFKSKKAYPSIPNQPSEASAHFMFELAKTVLTKAGGNSSTSLFTEPSTSQNHRGPHRALHMSAFQIGLYALGLHNCVSPNWLSRTYSSQVSWITGQAMEIGSAAITFLINTWEGHLTPPEVVSLADKASRGRDPNMVRAASELALSCLPHAHALNPNEIHRALIQCKEKSESMLERACLAVELAAKGGGVYPEVLFDVARRWYELYQLTIQSDNANGQSDFLEQHGVEASGFSSFDSQLPLMPAVTATPHQILPPPPSTFTYPALGPITPSPMPYPCVTAAPTPYNYIHQPLPATSTIFSQGTIFPAAYLQPNGVAPTTYPYPTNIQLAVPTSTYYTIPTTCAQLPPRSMPTLPSPLYATNAQMQPLNHPPPSHMPGHIPPQAQQASHVRPAAPFNQKQLHYLLAAYRVGMLAMETLARRVHDDRPQTKYARSPPYGEDVKWLLSVANKIGTSYLHQFCITTVNSVASPFVLQEIAVEAAYYLSRKSPAPIAQHLRSPILTPLVQKCQQMYIQCTHMKMFHINLSEFDEFINIILSARTAFQMTPGGMVQFNELLQSLRRSKSCKKELWQRITSACMI